MGVICYPYPRNEYGVVAAIPKGLKGFNVRVLALTTIIGKTSTTVILTEYEQLFENEKRWRINTRSFGTVYKTPLSVAGREKGGESK